MVCIASPHTQKLNFVEKKIGCNKMPVKFLSFMNLMKIKQNYFVKCILGVCKVFRPNNIVAISLLFKTEQNQKRIGSLNLIGYL